jgi:hypothetical protein
MMNMLGIGFVFTCKDLKRALNDNGGVDKVLNLHGIKTYGL